MSGFKLVPDEWLSALDTARAARLVVSSTHSAGFRHRFAVYSLLVVGAVAASAIDYALQGVAHGQRALVARSVMTLSGVLAGFLFAAVVFSGKAERVELMELEAFRHFKAKAIYLMWSQITTLGLHILAAISGLLWLLVEVGDAPGWARLLALVAAVALCFAATVRTLLLPWQILELHMFSLELVEQSKLDSIDRDLERARSHSRAA